MRPRNPRRLIQNRMARKALVAWPQLIVHVTKQIEPLMGLLTDEQERQQVQQAYATLIPGNAQKVTIEGASAFIQTMAEIEGQVRVGATQEGCRCGGDAKVNQLQKMPGHGFMVHVVSGHDVWCPLIARFPGGQEETTAA